MPKIQVNDIEIYYEIHGEGFPILMIHGFSANLDWWPQSIINELSKTFKVILFDNRGAGRTDKPDMEYSIRLFADDTAGLMDALNIKKTFIIGLSMGGYIAQELTLNYPEKVEKLILCGTSCGGSKSTPPSAETMKILMRDRNVITPEGAIREWIPILFSQDFITNHPDYIEYLIQRSLIAPIPPLNYRLQTKAVFSYNAGRKLKEIKTSTLILHGRKDIMLPSENAETISKLIPNAKLHIFDESGHLLFSERPEEVLMIIMDFLR
ncbi:MAG: alpha/beta fold hydrolase [Candidatus Hermodarchaeota archaeon]